MRHPAHLPARPTQPAARPARSNHGATAITADNPTPDNPFDLSPDVIAAARALYQSATEILDAIDAGTFDFRPDPDPERGPSTDQIGDQT